MIKRVIFGGLGSLILGIVAFCVAFYDATIEHGDRQKLNFDLANATDEPDGPDYVKAIRLHEQFYYYTDDERALSVATTMIAACQSRRAPCLDRPDRRLADAWSTIERLRRTSRDDSIRGLAKLWIERRNEIVPDARRKAW